MEPMNPFQRESLSAALTARPFLKPLAEKLLSLGGKVPVIWNFGQLTSESFIALLLPFGRITNGHHARFVPMTPSQCHTNVGELVAKSPNTYQKETGFALSKDGCWRPHSWAWDIQKAQIVEATELRTKYYGVTGM